MAKGNKGQNSATAASDSKKRKRASAAADAAPSAGFTLFGAKHDADLDNVFAGSAAFALPSVPVASSSKAVAAPAAEVEEDQDDDEDEEQAEEASEEGGDVEDVSGAEEDGDKDNEEGSDAESEDIDPTTLVHESTLSTSERRKRDNSRSDKYVPPEETKEGRDKRTIFVGNIPIEAAKGKTATSQLRAHLLTFVPSAKIESIRFRSVAFSKPTVAIVDDKDDEKEANKRAKREQNRAAAWRAAQEGSSGGAPGGRRGDDEVVDKSKSYIDAKGKRKVAFIKKDFHEEASSCNAYVVFAHPHPDRPKNVAPILDPYEAAEKVLAADGSSFMGRIIRVDHVRLPSAVGLSTAINNLSKRDAWVPAGTDLKQSVFVGGLDYAAKDEDVREFFEKLVTEERGKPEKFERWVTAVRIVRDKDTQLGKGFGYVHFADRESADEVISLPSTKLKFAKKPLRVQASKTLPPAAKRVADKGKAAELAGPQAKKRRVVPTGPIPRGNPELGDKLKDLSKEERKVAKATDADRQARRLAKKRAKVAAAHTDKGAVKLAATKAEKGRTAKKVKAKKGRVRSGNQLTKMKGQRSG